MNIDDMTYGDLKAIAAMFGGNQQTKQPAEEGHEIPVVVWTDRRGVIFGYTDNPHARPITLKRARMALYWSVATGGVFGLCDIGPQDGSKISAELPSADFEGVTGVASVSDAAVKAWSDYPVQGRK